MGTVPHSVKSKTKTALVVDDSKLARYVLKEMLLGKNIKVETNYPCQIFSNTIKNIYIAIMELGHK